MGFEILKVIPNMVIHWVNKEEIWTSSNYTIFKSTDGGDNFSKIVELKVPIWFSIAGGNRLIARALRLGIRSLRILKSGTILAIANKRVFRIRDNKAEVTYIFERGLGPLRQGWCEDEEGNVYIGEYFLNNKRAFPVRLLKSNDDGKTWRTIYSFENIRHIHCVQFDPFTRAIWVGTGDRDEESGIFYSKDEKNWVAIGSGNQMFRTVSLIFTKDYVYWGTDIPTRQNYICRFERKSGKIERLVAVDGPVHYSTILEDGTLIFATTVEGNSEGRSAEWDKRAHIWASRNGKDWEDIISWEKDRWPYLLGYGRILFGQGKHGKFLFLTTQCLKGIDNCLIKGRLKGEDHV